MYYYFIENIKMKVIYCFICPLQNILMKVPSSKSQESGNKQVCSALCCLFTTVSNPKKQALNHSTEVSGSVKYSLFSYVNGSLYEELSYIKFIFRQPCQANFSSQVGPELFPMFIVTCLCLQNSYDSLSYTKRSQRAILGILLTKISLKSQ